LPSPSVSTEPSPSPTAAASGSLASRSGTLAFAGVTDQGDNAPSIAEIYTIHADGSSLIKLTKQGQFAESPAWSPDGRYIAYTLRSEDQEHGLWVVSATGGTPRQVTDHAARRPAWSSNGDRIAFADLAESGGGLFMVDADGSDLRQVSLPPGISDDPAWSPDGRALVFTFFAANGNRESIYVAGADGSSVGPLIEAGTYSYAPSWSRDGKEIVFVQDGNVAIAANDGSRARLLTSGRSVDRPRLSPDGTRIAFTQNDGIWIMNRDGSAVTALSLDVDHAGFAAWRP
jgi:Tol biopolymer transport system component